MNRALQLIHWKKIYVHMYTLAKLLMTYTRKDGLYYVVDNL